MEEIIPLNKKETILPEGVEELIKFSQAVPANSKELLENWLEESRRINLDALTGDKGVWTRARLELRQRILQSQLDRLLKAEQLKPNRRNKVENQNHDISSENKADQKSEPLSPKNEGFV